MKTENTQKIKAQSKTQLAIAYDIDLRTFNKWINPFLLEIGDYRGGFYTPKQVGIIYDKIGSPD